MERRSRQFGAVLPLVLVGLGMLSIGLAWNGASGLTDLRAQFPYLLSGSFLGISLVVFGSALMLTQSARGERIRLEAKLDQVVDAIERAGGESGPGAVPADVTGLVAAGSASFHVPGCRLVEGRETVEYLTPAEAAARQLTPCRVCKPAEATASL
jgi:hypothetical protein